MMMQEETGCITFKENINNDNILHMKGISTISTLLHDDDWDISSRGYQLLHDQQVLLMIRQLKIKSFKLRWNNAQNILKEIFLIQFPNLQALYLNGNNIANIEALAFINMPQLTLLNLKQNHIQSIAPLSKCYTPNLKDLLLYHNDILQYSSLCRMNIENMNTIWLVPQNDSQTVNQDLTWVCKLNTQKLNNLYIINSISKKINNYIHKMRNKINHKYEGISIIYKMVDDWTVQI